MNNDVIEKKMLEDISAISKMGETHSSCGDDKKTLKLELLFDA
jgi:hypothetical protein